MNENHSSSPTSTDTLENYSSQTSSAFNDIQHFVVLMMENRSFDSTLGWLYEGQEDSPQCNIPHAKKGDEFRGLYNVDLEKFLNTADYGLSSIPVRGTSGYTVPSEAPGEEFARVNVQLFETETPLPHAVATMKGVLKDFVSVMEGQGYKEKDIKASATMIMQTYTPAQLPVLNQLAKHYAVCDGWFASSPSQTNSNRAFLLTGTSEGLVNNGQLETDPRARELEKILHMGIGDDRFTRETIFNALHKFNEDWGVFWQSSCLPHKIASLIREGEYLLKIIELLAAHLSIPIKKFLNDIAPYADYLTELTSGDLSSCYTWRLFPKIQELPNADQCFKSIDEFHSLARSGNLPKFSYIEPSWTIAHLATDAGIENLFTQLGNDYHPPGNTIVSENFVKDIYTSLIANTEAWNKTLLVIVFDEFVGSFDHVSPPPAIPPGIPGRVDSGFNFDRYGARVPAILVSPLIQKNTVFRSSDENIPYDHASIISTLLKLVGQNGAAGFFGARAEAAPTFDVALTLSKPRTDARDIDFLKTARHMGDLVLYRDPIVLKSQNGQYITGYQCSGKRLDVKAPDELMKLAVDLNIAAYFPTLGNGQKAPLTFADAHADYHDQIPDGASFFIITLEPGVESANFLGAWADSPDCYYYNNYVHGDYTQNETWIARQVENHGNALRYGDKIRLESVRSPGNFLSKNHERWINVQHGSSDYWIVEPAE